MTLVHVKLVITNVNVYPVYKITKMSPLDYVASVVNCRLRQKSFAFSSFWPRHPHLRFRTTVNTKTICFDLFSTFVFVFAPVFAQTAGAKLFARIGTLATQAIIYENKNFAERVHMNMSFIRLLSLHYVYTGWVNNTTSFHYVSHTQQKMVSRWVVGKHVNT